MANNPYNTELLDRAIIFAVKAHAGTERRGSEICQVLRQFEAIHRPATLKGTVFNSKKR